MRIAFIPSAYRTIFFHAMGKILEEAGHEIFWLSPNNRWAHWLGANGVENRKILDITRWGTEWTDGSALAENERRLIAEIELSAALRFRNILLMDNLLARRSEEYALKYLAVCARHLREFIQNEQIQLVLGEQTWAFELLTGQVCRSLGLSHLVPHTIRIPNGRFAFFDGHTETKLVGFGNRADTSGIEARTFLQNFRERYAQPDYMKIDRAVLKLDWDRLKLLYRHVIDLSTDSFDETSRRPTGLILDHTRRLAREKTHRLMGPFSQPETDLGRPFVFFPLHLQPEASIDIKGDPYSNQIEIVRAMARTLPVTHELYVKEHIVALPMRSRPFYRELLRIPGVKLIDPRANTYELTSRADLVVTITGTAAFEAALLGKPSATIAPIFFESIVRFPQFDPFQDSLARLLLEDPIDDFESKVEFLSWLLSRSFAGTVGDALWQPDSMADENLRQVAAGFQTLFEKYK